jgi:hypothetical protein
VNQEEAPVAQFDPEPNYDYRLMDRVITYLQTKDSQLFPFTEHFDAAKQRAFSPDLREGLAELTDSGSARKSSAVGFIMRDERLRAIVNEWAAANGDWPAGTDPRNPFSALGAVTS